MNPIEVMRDELAAYGATVRLRVPRDPKGRWWLDAKAGDRATSICWKEAEGFEVGILGISAEGEFFEGASEATACALRLLGLSSRCCPCTEPGKHKASCPKFGLWVGKFPVNFLPPKEKP